jgi:hypothetical protein
LGEQWSDLVVKTNIKPYNTLSVDKTMIFSSNVKLTGIIADTDGDKVKYRITKNGVAGNWSNLLTTPITIEVSYSSIDFDIGENNLLIEILDEFGGDNSANFIIRRKSLNSTYVSNVDTDINYFSDTVLKISNVFTTLIQMALDSSQGYLKSATTTLTMNVSGTGSVLVAKIMQPWDAESVTNGTLPTIDTAHASVQTISNQGTITLDISNAGSYGVAIYSVDLSLEASYIGNSVSIVYQPTQLNLPGVIYSNRVTLKWDPIIIPNPQLFIKTILRRSTNSSFTGVSSVFEITNINVVEFQDTTISTGSFYYRLEIEYANSPVNVVLLTNGMNVIAPNPGYRRVLSGVDYTLKLAEGLALDDVNNDYNFYTTADCIKLRQLDLGTVIGGRYSGVLAFEVINTYESSGFQVTIRAYTTDDNIAIDNGDSALLPDYETDEGKSVVEISQVLTEQFTDAMEYPLTFNLSAGEKKTVYVRVHPSIFGAIGTRTMKLKLTGNPI